MKDNRHIDRIFQSKPTSDGAGVKLKRVFGYYERGVLDPFLLFDFFGSDNPEDFISGFPWHPHRGIETVTYMLEGFAEHGDSMGNKGVIGKGDIQWMTAGSGIIHQEMPKGDNGKMYGFQLWVNLPKTHKMMNPRYQDLPAKSVPVVQLENGGWLKVLAGEYSGSVGPVKDIVADPIYYDIFLPEGKNLELEVKDNYTVFAYLYEGNISFGESEKDNARTGDCVKFTNGEIVSATAGKGGSKFLFVSGKPLNEPIAWGGPIVMNTAEELEAAFKEYREGTFIKK